MEMESDQQAELEALQNELMEAEQALTLTEEESRKIKVERDRVEEELFKKRGETQIKVAPED